MAPQRGAVSPRVVSRFGPVLDSSSAEVRVDLYPCSRPGLHLIHGPSDLPWFQGSLEDQGLEAQRTTVLQGSGGLLRTPEHLLAAHLCWPRCGTRAVVWGREIPILDGSAWPWWEALREIHGEPTGALAWREVLPGALPFEDSWGYGSLRAIPAADATASGLTHGLRIECVLERGGARQTWSGVLRTPEDLYPILQARTFIFEADWHRAREAGLLTGAKEGCGILLSEGDLWEPISGGPLRHPAEPVLHKILDLLGDLALLGPEIPRFDLFIKNGGHCAHHRLLRRISTPCRP